VPSLSSLFSATSFFLDTEQRAFLVRVARDAACGALQSPPLDVVVQLPCTADAAAVAGTTADAPPLCGMAGVAGEACTPGAGTFPAGYVAEALPRDGVAPVPAVFRATAAERAAPRCGADVTGAVPLPARFLSLRARAPPLRAGAAAVVVLRVPPAVWERHVAPRLAAESADATLTAATQDVSSARVDFFLHLAAGAGAGAGTSSSPPLLGAPTTAPLGASYARLTRRFAPVASLWCGAADALSVDPSGAAAALATPALAVDEAWEARADEAAPNRALPPAPGSSTPPRLPAGALALLTPAVGANLAAVELLAEAPCGAAATIVVWRPRCAGSPPEGGIGVSPSATLPFSPEAERRTFTLSAMSARDVDGDAILLSWRVLARPPASRAALPLMPVPTPFTRVDGSRGAFANASIVSFTPDVGGE
jgi:hypothetical protein